MAFSNFWSPREYEFATDTSLERLVTAVLVEFDDKWATTDKPYISSKTDVD